MWTKSPKTKRSWYSMCQRRWFRWSTMSRSLKRYKAWLVQGAVILILSFVLFQWMRSLGMGPGVGKQGSVQSNLIDKLMPSGPIIDTRGIQGSIYKVLKDAKGGSIKSDMQQKKPEALVKPVGEKQEEIKKETDTGKVTLAAKDVVTNKPKSEISDKEKKSSNTTNVDKGHDADKNQEMVNYIAKYVLVKYDVLQNGIAKEKRFMFKAMITLTNSGDKAIMLGDWSIFFNHMPRIESGMQLEKGYVEFAKSGIRIAHQNAGLYRMYPGPHFRDIQAHSVVNLTFSANGFMVARTDAMPNWYAIAPGAKPCILKSTEGEGLEFVGKINKPETWKRTVNDTYEPFTPQKRYKLNDVKKVEPGKFVVIPTPAEIHICTENKKVKVDKAEWVIQWEGNLQKEADFLSDITRITTSKDKKTEKVIHLSVNDTKANSKLTECCGNYTLNITAQPPAIKIRGISAAGVFYGIQTLLSILQQVNWTDIPVMNITDFPRFPYRGIMLDVSRNFLPKAEVQRILKGMAMYKLNVLHLHITDDDGWRIEIPELPELTKVGGCRAHDLNETQSLIPNLGSGPHMEGLGCGFYTVQDYQEILVTARDLHIEVIPEVDMPGHSHAAIKAMKSRYLALLKKGDKDGAAKYLLEDLEDTSKYYSAQAYKDNAMNMCLEAVYTFIEKVVKSFVDMHKSIQPLRTFHFGGDEIPRGALNNSVACQTFMKAQPKITNLREYFISRVSKIMEQQNLTVQGWEDVFFQNDVLSPVSKFGSAVPKVANVWLNRWQDGRFKRAFEMANADYKVVLSSGTHMYFDHPHEPDPEERGLYWATRYTNTAKVFRYRPINFYDNIDVDRNGNPMKKDDVCVNNLCIPLTKKQNVIGISGQVWSETLRLPGYFHAMLFPRAIALAERSWHEASWEEQKDKAKQKEQEDLDWAQFATALGHTELKRLEELGIEYYLALPGAMVGTGTVQANTAFPGVPIEYSKDNGTTWEEYKATLPTDTNYLFASRTYKKPIRRSRPVELISKKT